MPNLRWKFDCLLANKRLSIMSIYSVALLYCSQFAPKSSQYTTQYGVSFVSLAQIYILRQSLQCCMYCHILDCIITAPDCILPILYPWLVNYFWKCAIIYVDSQLSILGLQSWIGQYVVEDESTDITMSSFCIIQQCIHLPHWGRVTHICVSKLYHHWFR